MRRFSGPMMLAAWWSTASAAMAAPPELKSLSPAGARRGATVVVKAAGNVKPWPATAWTSESGLSFAPQKEEGSFEVAVDAKTAPGVYWVRLVNSDGASVPRPFIVGAIDEATETEPNDELAQAADLGDEPTTINGALAKAGDVDCYRVRLRRGQTLVAASDANAALGSPIDAVLQVTDTTGNVLAQNNDDRGLDPFISFVAPRDGEFIVRIFGFASDPNSSIRYAGAAEAIYRLTLTAGPVVDHAFPVAVPTGTVSQVAAAGWNLAAAATADADLAGRAAVGRRWLRTDAAGRALVVGVDVSTAIEQSGDAPQSIASPVVVNGRISTPGDRDTYLVAAKKGESLRVRVVSRALGFPVDAVLLIEQLDGTQLTRVDDIGRGDPDVDTVFRAPADGEYRLVVEDLFGNGGERYVYLLDVRSVEADFALSAAASEFAGEVGKPLEIPITIDRPNGMTGEIEVRLEGLPQEFAAATVLSPAKGDAAKKVTLKLSAARAFSGPVRIVGSLKPDATVLRAATSPIAAVPGARIDDFWITIKGK